MVKNLLFNAFDSNRIMYGSDWPVSVLAGSYEQVIQVLEKYIQWFPEEEQHLVMGGNACTFYGLE